MAERSLSDWFPELKEVESKLGRKTPESLLMWMRDAVDCGDSWRSDEVNGGDSSAFYGSFSDRICSLQEEMRWLRSADVRILRQLVAVHEGIEAMRWLMEERGGSVSGGSSLTGSLSSLVSVDEDGPSDIPCRESLSPTCSQDLTETVGEEALGQQSPHSDNSDLTHQTSCNVLSPGSTIMRPPGPSHYIFEVASSNPDSGLFSVSLQESQPQDLDAGLLQGIKGGTIRRALIRSRKRRKGVNVDTCSLAFTQESVGTLTEHSPPQETFKASQSHAMEEERALPEEEVLLGYDAQWCWVESQDDVTYL